MKSKVLALILSVLIPVCVFADTTAQIRSDLVGLGMKPEMALYLSDLLTDGNISYDNADYIKWRNAAGTADISVLRVDGSDDTILNADSGDVIGLAIAGTTEVTVRNDELEFSGASGGTVDATTSLALAIGGTAEVTVSNDALTFSGAAASIVGGATSLTVGSSGSTIVKADADANRLLTFDATGDDALTLLFGDGSIAAPGYVVGTAQADADDDANICLSPGSACANTRGGFFHAYGNEAAAGNAGRLIMNSGNVAGADSITRSADDFFWETQNGGAILATLTEAGALSTAAGITAITGNIVAMAGGFQIPTTGQSLAIDNDTAASACRGSTQTNGTTAVTVNTTCVGTNDTVLISPNTDPGGSAVCWVADIVNATSFDLDCSGASTGFYHWVIVKDL